MDLSKAFDFVSHDLLIVKMHAYGFDLDTLTFFYSYLKNRKKSVKVNKFVGAVLMDLSKAFDCVPHDLLIAKIHAYGFDLDTLTFFYSYFKNRKQSVKVNNVLSTFLVLLSGVPLYFTLLYF